MLTDGCLLQKDLFIENRIDKTKWRSKLTVGIVGICDVQKGAKIVFSADRQVTTFVKYEGLPKIRQVTPNCFYLYSTNDDSICTVIVSQIFKRINDLKMPIEKIVQIVSDECRKYRENTIERDVLSKYNLVTNTLHADPNTLAQEAKKDVLAYSYKFSCEFVIFGFDKPSSPHIYSVDEKGSIKQHDNSGFETTGAGGDIAFAELTKYPYHPYLNLGSAILAIYFAKCESERVSSVGENTDIAVLYYAPNTKDDGNTPKIYIIDRNNELMDELDGTYDKVSGYELKQLHKSTATIMEKLGRIDSAFSS